VLKFRDGITGNVADDASAAFTFYSFEAAGFNQPGKRDPLLAAGVRWSLRPETRMIFSKNKNNMVVIPESETTFTKDLEPEYLALSADGKTVYVSLQENCAVAIFDLEAMAFKDIKPLQPKYAVSPPVERCATRMMMPACQLRLGVGVYGLKSQGL